MTALMTKTFHTTAIIVRNCPVPRVPVNTSVNLPATKSSFNLKFQNRFPDVEFPILTFSSIPTTLSMRQHKLQIAWAFSRQCSSYLPKLSQVCHWLSIRFFSTNPLAGAVMSLQDDIRQIQRECSFFASPPMPPICLITQYVWFYTRKSLHLSALL